MPRPRQSPVKRIRSRRIIFQTKESVVADRSPKGEASINELSIGRLGKRRCRPEKMLRRANNWPAVSLKRAGSRLFCLKAIADILHGDDAFGFGAEFVAQAGDMLVNGARIDLHRLVQAPDAFQKLIAGECLAFGL